MALLGGHQPYIFDDGLLQGKLHRLCNLAGFIAVVRLNCYGLKRRAPIVLIAAYSTQAESQQKVLL